MNARPSEPPCAACGLLDSARNPHAAHGGSEVFSSNCYLRDFSDDVLVDTLSSNKMTSSPFYSRDGFMALSKRRNQPSQRPDRRHAHLPVPSKNVRRRVQSQRRHRNPTRPIPRRHLLATQSKKPASPRRRSSSTTSSASWKCTNPEEKPTTHFHIPGPRNTLECKRRRRRQIFYFHNHCCAERNGNTRACASRQVACRSEIG